MDRQGKSMRRVGYEAGIIHDAQPVQGQKQCQAKLIKAAKASSLCYTQAPLHPCATFPCISHLHSGHL